MPKNLEFRQGDDLRKGGVLLALDFGGTKLSAAIAGIGERNWRASARVHSPPNKNARYDFDTMLALARRLLASRVPKAVGVSFGGPVDAARGRVILSHHVPGWEDTPLRDQLQNAFGAPVSIDNDANVAALGEYTFGAGQGCASLLYVTVSTGVGGGVSKSGEKYFTELRAAARANTLPQMRVDSVPAALGDDAPLWGAMALAEMIA